MVVDRREGRNMFSSTNFCSSLVQQMAESECVHLFLTLSRHTSKSVTQVKLWGLTETYWTLLGYLWGIQENVMLYWAQIHSKKQLSPFKSVGGGRGQNLYLFNPRIPCGVSKKMYFFTEHKTTTKKNFLSFVVGGRGLEGGLGGGSHFWPKFLKSPVFVIWTNKPYLHVW